MSATVPPYVPAQLSPAQTPVQSWHSQISVYIKAHERIILLGLALAFGVGLYSRIVNYLEHKDQLAADKSTAALQAQHAADVALAAKNADLEAEYQQLAQQLTDTNKALTAAITARDTATQKQQETDRTLPPPALAARWTGLLKDVAPDSIQPAPGGFTVTQDAAVSTVVSLEAIPQLSNDLKDEQTINSNLTAQITSLVGVNTGLHEQIDGLNLELAKQEKACTDDKNLLKVQSRKGKLKWFGIGYAAGLTTRGLVKIFTGI